MISDEIFYFPSISDYSRFFNIILSMMSFKRAFLSQMLNNANFVCFHKYCFRKPQLNTTCWKLLELSTFVILDEERQIRPHYMYFMTKLFENSAKILHLSVSRKSISTYTEAICMSMSSKLSSHSFRSYKAKTWPKAYKSINGHCNRKHCSFQHVCQKCSETHPKILCPSVKTQAIQHIHRL